MTDRDDLAALLYESLAADDDCGYVVSMGGPGHTTIDGTIDLIAVADRILAAGYSKP